MAAKKKAVVKTVVKRSSTKKEVPLDGLINTCLRGISELYPKQDPAPGMVLSFLPNGRFYASFARYEGREKIVTHSETGATLDEAVRNLVAAWQAGTAHARRLASIGQSINIPIPQPFKTGTMNETAGIKGRKSLVINLENMRGGLIDEIKSLVYRG